MLSTVLSGTHLGSLQSSDEISLLDTIDKLRSLGVSHYISLPQLIVCGDQSCGKSSVLEAISGIPFPTKDNLCTRFATEFILRRTQIAEVGVSIVPSQARSQDECKRLSDFEETLTDFNQLPAIVERAKDFMGLSTSSSAFSDDVLRVEISGPDQQHLTIVDLPGLIHSENKGQTAADGFTDSFYAKNDYANQIVTKLSKDVDPRGHRTLAIITKPDTLPVGSESETGYGNLARNQVVEFRLGWHVLRNRDYETRNTTLEARDNAEEQFFSQGMWKGFPRHGVGITSLRTRLSKVLLEQIRNELPSLVAEIETKINEIRGVLHKSGASRTSIDEQRLFLLQISQSFQAIVKAAVDGTYGDPFFGEPRSADGYSKRLRAVVQNLNLDFARTMETRGHRRHIVDCNDSDTPPSTRRETLPEHPEPDIIGRSKFLEEITDLLKRSRGRELPGMFSPLIVGDLFHEQSAPWERLMQLHLRAVWEAARSFLEFVTFHLADDQTADGLLREIINPLMEQRYQDMKVKLFELLVPHQKGHPITHNHYFTETIQNMREKRHEAEITRRLMCVYGRQDLANLEELPLKKVRTSTLISVLASRNEADMDRYASSEVLDCMQAYYKVAMKTMIDSIAVQVVETLLVGQLGDLLSAARIMQMKSDDIAKIAEELPENRFRRQELARKLGILQAGIETCRRSVGPTATDLQHRPWQADLHAFSEDESEDAVQGMRSPPIEDNRRHVVETRDVIDAPSVEERRVPFPVEVSSLPQNRRSRYP